MATHDGEIFVIYFDGRPYEAKQTMRSAKTFITNHTGGKGAKKGLEKWKVVKFVPEIDASGTLVVAYDPMAEEVSLIKKTAKKLAKAKPKTFSLPVESSEVKDLYIEMRKFSDAEEKLKKEQAELHYKLIKEERELFMLKKKLAEESEAERVRLAKEEAEAEHVAALSSLGGISERAQWRI